MLSNAYFLAKFRFDTAENEPAKNLQKFCNFFLQIAFLGRHLDAVPLGGGARRARLRALPLQDLRERARLREVLLEPDHLGEKFRWFGQNLDVLGVIQAL